MKPISTIASPYLHVDMLTFTSAQPAAGRPAMICGATGSLAVLVPETVQQEHGKVLLFYAVPGRNCFLETKVQQSTYFFLLISIF